MDCTLVKKIYEDSSDACTVYKCAISPDGTRIYVTDNSHDSLLTLSLDGTVQSTLDDYAHRDPIGVHVVGEEEIVTLASQEDGLHHT
ncbi:hypothetical protein DPMN_044304 [Dreissena polymorpha]|uniref:Uncharacterized protein n=1 Tax=Dreissena polymorpha TaxID=45954 RepID=A0A9D4I0E5_DREPO|nr:hypothetical protein DPMN_044304 [Dreissena polymorpha]